MDISKWIGQAKDLGYSALAMASGAVGAGLGYVKTAIGSAWLFGSTETSSSYDHDRFDEKHYFLIPDRLSEVGYSLYVMRCLPEAVPPINDLPKRRLFHLPNENALPTLEHILISDARKVAERESTTAHSFGARLHDIADQIDRLDGRMFQGVLLIGGLVALINPIAGAAVAAKALVPSIGLLLSKYGLQYVGDTTNARELGNRIRAAEKEVLQQFHDSGTDSIVNPLLCQLDRALETTDEAYDPILEFQVEELHFGERGKNRMLHLTCRAISNAYKELLSDPSAWERARLGPEDIRYLKMILQIAETPKGPT